MNDDIKRLEAELQQAKIDIFRKDEYIKGLTQLVEELKEKINNFKPTPRQNNSEPNKRPYGAQVVRPTRGSYD